MLEKLFFLLVLYQLKHFIADYLLQGKYMLRKFLPGWEFLLPLLAHVAVHGALTLAICLWLNPTLWWLALVDMGVHFTMDRIKAGPKYMGRWKPLSPSEFKYAHDAYVHIDNIPEYTDAYHKLRGNKFFWWSLGLDQMVHHLTHYFIVFMLAKDEFHAVEALYNVCMRMFHGVTM